MFKEFISVFKKITLWKITGSYVAIFIFLSFFPIKLVPDYLSLNNLADKKDILFRLLTTTIGFSGLILTILLVAYNFYIKSVRRNTLDFITDNRWMRLIFSCFFGNVLFLTLGFFFITTIPNSGAITILYFSYYLTLLFIICVFPAAILSLNDTVSLKKIEKLLQKIQIKDIEELYNPNFQQTDDWHYRIEKNPILMVKDVCINAIADKDWILPQTVLNKLYQLLIGSLSAKSEDQLLEKNVYVWTLFSNHIKNEIIKMNDTIAGKTLLFLNMQAHEDFAKKKIIGIRSNGIDDFLKDFFRLILENNLFAEIQPYFQRYTTDIVKTHYENLNYSDKEVPTIFYRFDMKGDNDYKPTPIRNYWYYVVHELPDIVFTMLEDAIDAKRKAAYNHFSCNVHYMISAVLSEKNHLTEFQKREASLELLRKAEQLTEYAIENGIYDGIEPVSEIEAVSWLKKDKLLGYRAVFAFTRMLEKLSKKNALTSFYTDEYFRIIRAMANQNFETVIFNDIVGIILENSIKLLKNEKTSGETKKDFLSQLHWFYNDYLLVNEILQPMKEKYEVEIGGLIKDYDPKEDVYRIF